MTYSIGYSWKDDTEILHNRIEVVDSDEISVYKGFGFDWPSYLIPLIIGFAFSQIGTILGDMYKQRREIKLKLEQARGILLAGMQAAKKCVEKKEEITFSFWEDLIVKENLYPSLIRYGRRINHPDLAKQLAELSIMLKQYNSLRLKENLSEDFVIDVEDELEKLMKTVENH